MTHNQRGRRRAWLSSALDGSKFFQKPVPIANLGKVDANQLALPIQQVQLMKPAILDQAPPSALAMKLTDISSRVESLNNVARAMMERTGVRGDQLLVTKFATEPVLAMVQAFCQAQVWFQVGKGNEGAGIYWYEAPSMLEAVRNPESVKCQMVTGTSVTVKQLFLDHAEELFAEYLQKTESTFSEIEMRLTKADALIDQLRKML